MTSEKKITKREHIRSYLGLDHRSHIDGPQIVERLPDTDPATIKEIAGAQIELLAVYHNLVLDQARRSFRWALLSASVGFVFFLAAIGFVVFLPTQNAAVISLVSGALLEAISALNFLLYSQASKQLVGFQTRLDLTQRVLLANSIAETLDGDYKQKSRTEIVKTLLGNAEPSTPEKS